MTIALAVHGGAGAWTEDRIKPGLEGVASAARVGFKILKSGGSALDAVEAAVNSMEDDPIFNAGYGSTLTLTGEIEMDASIMEGRHLRAGAVTMVKDIKHPVSLARQVMEKTDHVLLGAWGAERLADLLGAERRDPRTERAMKRWREAKERFLKGEIARYGKIAELVKGRPEFLSIGTVGAVALDRYDDSAAATSTGGMVLKFPGRIGDTPLIGSGTYADNSSGAVSATGTGEVAIRLALAKTVCDYMRGRLKAQSATDCAIKLVNNRIPMSMGLIAVDRKGGIGATHNTPAMCWAYMKEEMDKPKAKVTAKMFPLET